MNGITFNGLHSFLDFGLILNSKTITTPSKKKIKASIPGMNSIYDFSTIASGGEIVYEQRAQQYNFTLVCSSKAQLHSELSGIFAWVQDVGQSQLIDDSMIEYYFLAEIEGSIGINEKNNIAEITLNFIAEPFKTGVYLEGSDIWDTFNFLTGITQDVSFDVIGTETVNIINAGRYTVPTITSTAIMSLVFGGVTYNLAIGENKFYDFKLLNGDNSIVINGTGVVAFIFRLVSL